MANLDISVLEGWLIKKKTKEHGLKLFGNDTRRWFKMQKLKSEDGHEELALCYFKSDKLTKEAKGWIFINDIVEIQENSDSFTVISPSRTMVLEAQTRAEHRLWVQGIVKLCPQAVFIGSKSFEINKPMNADSKGGGMYDTRDFGMKPTGRDAKDEVIEESKRSEEAPRRAAPPARHSSSATASDDDSDGLNRRPSNGLTPYRPPKDDHRLKHAPAANKDMSTSSRLHGHIRREADDKAPISSSAAAMREAKRLDRESSDNSLTNQLSRDNSDSSVVRNRSPAEDAAAESALAVDLLDDELESLDASQQIKPNKHTLLKTQRSQENVTPEPERSEPEAPRRPPPSAAPPSKKLPAPPSGPPPRRARDIADEDGAFAVGDLARRNGANGTSVDDLVARGKSLSVDLNDSDDDMLIDFKAEKRRYTSGDQEDAKPDNNSRPPRPPTKNISPKLNKSIDGDDAKPTRPKPSAQHKNAGVGMDADFVNEDWDEEDDEDAKPVSRQHVKNAAAPPSSCRPDENWLHEDFDDD